METNDERNLIARLNRKLKPHGERVCICREDSPNYNELGRYYVVNDRNAVIGKHIDPEAWLETFQR